jgi:hypothetical protein
MTTDQLRKLHNLALSCETEQELNEYCLALNIPNITAISGEATLLPMYYLTPSRTTNKKQDRHGKWYDCN